MMDDITLEADWHFPFLELPLADHGYRTVLKALAPVEAYRLRVVIDDASRYELSPWLKTHEGTPFSCANKTPTQEMGSCGLGILRRQQ